MSATWNLLVYAIAGDATEHQNVLSAIDDMRAALTTDRCRVAVQIMARGKTSRYWIDDDDEIRAEAIDLVDASRAAPLTSFLAAAAARHPAASTALALWAHGSGLDHVHTAPHKPPSGGAGAAGAGLGGSGGGWSGVHGWLGFEADRRGADPAHPPARRARQARYPGPPGPPSYGCRWGPDPNTGDFLTNVTMKKAIAAGPHGAVDLLALNACWMATLEVEYELRRVAGAVVASQVYCRPWPYRAIVESLSRRPAQSAEQLAQAIVTSVGSEIAADQRRDAVSAFRAGAALDDLAAAFDRYASRATLLIDSDWDAVRDAVMARAQRLDDPYQVDLASLVKVLGRGDAEAQDAALEVARQLDAMRIGNAVHHDHPGLGGLSILCPKTTDVDLADAYAGTEFRSNAWAGFLRRFQTRLAAS